MTTSSAEEIKVFLAELIRLTEQGQLVESSSSFLHLLENRLALGPLNILKLEIGLGARTLIHLSKPIWLSSSTTDQLEDADEAGERWVHSFRQGDQVEIRDWEKGDSKTGKSVTSSSTAKPLEGVVWKVLQQKLIVAINPAHAQAGASDEDQLPQLIKLLKVSNTVTSSRQISTLRQLERLVLTSLSYNTPISPLISLLLGLSSLPPPPPLSSPPPPNPYFFDPLLNPSQISAILHCLSSSNPVSLLWGPPGTGKTQTLLEIIRQFLSPPFNYKKILVCSASNWAVDNLLLRLLIPPPLPLTSSSSSTTLQSPPQIRPTRLGNPTRSHPSLQSHTLESQSSRTSSSLLLTDIRSELEALEKDLVWKPQKDFIKEKKKNGSGGNGKNRKMKWDEVRYLRKEFRKREDGGVREVIQGANVVLGTLHSAGSKLIQSEEFDVVIIDEAAQCVEPGSWIPILKLKFDGKLILAGDHLQLPPTVLAGSEEWEKGKKVESPASAGGGKKVKVTNSGRKQKGKDVGDQEKEKVKDAEKQKEKIVEEAIVEKEDEKNIKEKTPDQLPPEGEQTPDSTVAVKKVTSSNANEGTLSLPSPPSPKISPGPCRLPPPPSLSSTLFSRLLSLHGPQIRKMLTIQYRFNSKINSFPSKQLYEGELSCHESVEGRKLSQLVLDDEERKTVEIETDEQADEEVIFYDTAGAAMYERSSDQNNSSSSSKSNENEATIVISHVESLISAKVPPSKIAIISPYNAQVSLLSSLLHPLYPQLEIGSVDGFQGREKEVVIISLVRSNPEGEVGFLKDERRLNVAMTRARSQLVVVGDSTTVSKGGKFLKAWMNWLEDEADVRLALAM